MPRMGQKAIVRWPYAYSGRHAGAKWLKTAPEPSIIGLCRSR